MTLHRGRATSKEASGCGGSSSGASGYSRSAAILSGVRLVVTIRSSGQQERRPFVGELTQSGYASRTGSSSGFDPILDGLERLRNAT